MQGLVFADVTTMDLLLGDCPNGHRHIFGFPQQLEGRLDLSKLIITTTAECRECGCEVVRVDRVRWAAGYVTDGAGI